jgi:trk system potassium uptake protein TrkH
MTVFEALQHASRHDCAMAARLRHAQGFGPVCTTCHCPARIRVGLRLGGDPFVGALILTLPIASAAGQWTPPVDALFTAISAVCITGLVVLDTGSYWSGFGQAVILALIQVGGFGLMTSSTLLVLLLRRQATMRERVLLREELGSGGLGPVFLLARKIMLYTLVAEIAGAGILSVAFLGEVDPPQAVWWGVFHAISAFNNAGFDVFGGFRSLVPFNQRPEILVPIALLPAEFRTPSSKTSCSAVAWCN